MSVIFGSSSEIEWTGSENAARFELFADTAAELTGLTHFDNIKILSGSKAKDISTGDNYLINSAGVWVLQPSDNAFVNVYTKSEIDGIVYDLNSDIAAAENDIAELHSGLSYVINTGGKNRLQNSATSRTVNGVTFTVNADGTVSASGTATANAYIQIAAIPADGGLFDGTYRLSGCPEGGSRSTYALYAASGDYARYDYGQSISLTPAAVTGNIYIIVMIYSGATVDNIVFDPMICSGDEWTISHDYAPYCPTLPELYAMVRSYHP